MQLIERMKFGRIALAAVFATLAVVVKAQKDASSTAAEEEKPASTQKVPEGFKQYVVSFHDEVSMEQFDAASKWITEHKGEIVESINENFAKLIIAKMEPKISKSTK